MRQYLFLSFVAGIISFVLIRNSYYVIQGIIIYMPLLYNLLSGLCLLSVIQNEHNVSESTYVLILSLKVGIHLLILMS
jgi:hypothetical protein